MRLTPNIVLCLLCTLLHTSLHGQPLQSEANDPNAPAYSDIRPQDTAQLRATVKRMREVLQELREGDLGPTQQQAALDQLIRGQHEILRQHNTWLDWQQPQTVDSAALLLERMIFEEAAEIAPTANSREVVLQNAPGHLGLKPKQQQLTEIHEPPLLAPVETAGDTATEAQRQVVDIAAANATVATTPIATTQPQTTDNGDQEVDAGTKVKVAVLADDKTTTDMHEDNTVLRNVTDEDGDLVLFGTMHLWAGGAIQLDAYQGENLFTFNNGGDSDTKSYIRRGEGILRASVMENAEIKAQYDFDTNEFRDLYWRWLSQSTSRSLTIGNQKEPVGLDYLVGSKFSTAMEPSAPSSAFGSLRSAGIRYNGWATLPSTDNPIRFWGDSSTFVTASIGLFGEDIENSNDTDRAVTGRLSMGGQKTEKTGFHLGASASYRHGEYDRIAPRPGLQEVNRIPLAQPEADTQALVALEALYGMGSLHGQVELYYSDYSGGDVDAQGWGGYGQVGWLFGGKQRRYQPKWGIWGQVQASHEPVYEIFGRFSFTYGNDDINPSNEMALLTLGGNWYYRRLRVSTNVIFADTGRDLFGESDGHAIALRLQYLF